MKFSTYIILVFISLACTQTPQEKVVETSENPGAKAQFSVEKTDKPVILFFGNSITFGYGIEPEFRFSSLIENRLDTLGYKYLVVNAGLSGETTASGFSRVNWVLKQIPEIFVLELGANDGLRGIKVDETRKNLKLIINRVKEANPAVKILLAGMEVPPSMGEDYAGAFRKIFPEISQTENVSLIPFILDKVAGESELNIEDGIHPTEEGHQIVAETVWTYLEPLLSHNQKIELD